MNQDKEVRIEAAELGQAMQAEFEQLLKETADALNKARDGAIIADSEWVVYEAMAKFKQKVFEKAVQMKADKAAKAAFSPSAKREGDTAAGQGGSRR
jgi:4-alpha-glucanotransferase